MITPDQFWSGFFWRSHLHRKFWQILANFPEKAATLLKTKIIRCTLMDTPNQFWLGVFFWVDRHRCQLKVKYFTRLLARL
ncbi:MAG: hypothetical protein MUE44_07970 [Oscillatoriaceae cyanobacterium Prado104]|nr:hypothetical protein [Oscillatoriaceae cyanobacterium Prado104]